MQVTDPDSIRHMEERLAQIHELKSEVSESIEPLENLKRNVRTLHASADAATAQAEMHKRDLRMLIIDSLAKPSLKLHQASAEQRASLELAVQYRELAEEGERQIGDLTAAASTKAKQLERLREQTLSEYADLVIQEAFQPVAERLRVAFAIKHTLLSRSRFSGDRERYLGDAAAAVHGQMRVALERVLEGAEILDLTSADPVIEAFHSSRVEGFEPMTPAQIARQRSRA
jgi:hypothetical protein